MYVFVQIGGYRQLAKIRPMVMESLTDGLVSLLVAGHGDRVIREEGMLIFPFDIDRDNRSKRISGLFGAYDLLRESRSVDGCSSLEWAGQEGRGVHQTAMHMHRRLTLPAFVPPDP